MRFNGIRGIYTADLPLFSDSLSPSPLF